MQRRPDAQPIGYDNYPPANANAVAAGISDNVRSELCDVTKGIPGTYNLITSFHVVHDMPHPRPTLKEIKNADRPGGISFVLEISFFGNLHRATGNRPKHLSRVEK